MNSPCGSSGSCWSVRKQVLRLEFAAIIRPVQQRLPLTPAAPQISRTACKLQLPHMAANGFPTLDLPHVFVRHPAAHVVAAVPLEPAARIIGMKPALLAPFRKRLAGINAEIVERWIAATWRELGAFEPRQRELVAAIGHVPAAEHTKPKHFGRREVGFELRIEVATNRLDKFVAIVPLHPIINSYRSSHAAMPQKVQQGIRLINKANKKRSPVFRVPASRFQSYAGFAQPAAYAAATTRTKQILN